MGITTGNNTVYQLANLLVDPLGPANLYKNFYANGRFWVFYADGVDSFIYKSSNDNGATWSLPTTIKNGLGALFDGARFGVSFDPVGIVAHYGIRKPPDILYRAFTPNADGSITYLAAEQTVVTNPNGANICCITTNSSGYPIISTNESNGAQRAAIVYLSSTKNGPWTIAAGSSPYCNRLCKCRQAECNYSLNT